MKRVPVLRARSPVAGLHRRTLGTSASFAQSVATTAPAGAMAATPLLVAADAGRAAPWSFAVAAVLVGLVAACIAAFSRRMAAAGSLYSFTAKGLGPGGAYACAVAMVVGYGLLVAAALAGAAWYGRVLATRLWPAATSGGGGVAVGAAIVVLLAATAGVCAVRGVRLAGRVMLIVESVSIGLILVVLTAVLVGAGPGAGSTAAAAIPPDPGLAGIAAGILPALAAFIGFDSAASLAVETRRPFATVPRAIGATAGVAAVLYLAATVVQLAAPGALPGVAGEPDAAVTMPGQLAWTSALIDIGVVASFSACALAALNTLARVLFSLARDGIAPAALGRTHRRHLTPAVAVAVVLPLLAAAPLVGTLAGARPAALFGALVSVATVGFLAAYVLVCLAAPRFLARIGELTRGVVVAAAVAVPALVAVVAVAVVRAGPGLPLVLLALIAAGVAGWVVLYRRRHEALRTMGVYDETTAGDVLDGSLR